MSRGGRRRRGPARCFVQPCSSHPSSRRPLSGNRTCPIFFSPKSEAARCSPVIRTRNGSSLARRTNPCCRAAVPRRAIKGRFANGGPSRTPLLIAWRIRSTCRAVASTMAPERRPLGLLNVGLKAMFCSMEPMMPCRVRRPCVRWSSGASIERGAEHPSSDSHMPLGACCEPKPKKPL